MPPVSTLTDKCVIIVDAALPLGLIANAAAVLGMSLGRFFPEMVGPDLRDLDGRLHLGISEFNLPILKSDAAQIRELRARLYEAEYAGLTAVDFSGLGQGCRDYGDFAQKLAATPESLLKYSGLAVCGDKKLVNRLTGSMPLLR